jgi:signal peptidase I
VAEIFLVALAMAMVLRAFLLQAFVIPSVSMLPTLQQRDRILVDKFFYQFEDPRRGDLVVFDSPEKPGTFFVKRIVGLPGEVVSMTGPDVLIDGQPLAENYRDDAPTRRGEGGGTTRQWQVPSGQFFMLGDNRPGSSDSRTWGCLPRGRIAGRALIRYWPMGRFGVLR